VLIDDSADIRNVLSILLEREPDFRVVGEAEDGQAGVESVAAQRPHLVLLDIAMPVMDGLQALTLIREESPGSIIVMLSAFGEDSGVMEKAFELGAHGFIRKGVKGPEMLAELRSVLTTAFPVPDHA
jgi:DNA-binding NarL/FixJ family response regulator